MKDTEPRNRKKSLLRYLSHFKKSYKLGQNKNLEKFTVTLVSSDFQKLGIKTIRKVYSSC